MPVFSRRQQSLLRKKSCQSMVLATFLCCRCLVLSIGIQGSRLGTPAATSLTGYEARPCIFAGTNRFPSTLKSEATLRRREQTCVCRPVLETASIPAGGCLNAHGFPRPSLVRASPGSLCQEAEYQAVDGEEKTHLLELSSRDWCPLSWREGPGWLNAL